MIVYFLCIKLNGDKTCWGEFRKKEELSEIQVQVNYWNNDSSGELWYVIPSSCVKRLYGEIGWIGGRNWPIK